MYGIIQLHRNRSLKIFSSLYLNIQRNIYTISIQIHKTCMYEGLDRNTMGVYARPYIPGIQTLRPVN